MILHAIIVPNAKILIAIHLVIQEIVPSTQSVIATRIFHIKLVLALVLKAEKECYVVTVVRGML